MREHLKPSSSSAFKRALLLIFCAPLYFKILDPPPGGVLTQILVCMCRGKVKNWQGLRNELPVERENGGLRNELEPFWAWKWGAPERAWSVLAWKWDSPELPDASG